MRPKRRIGEAPASAELKKATPHLVNTFNVLNALFNTLAYQSRGQQSYLFYGSWLSHIADSLTINGPGASASAPGHAGFGSSTSGHGQGHGSLASQLGSLNASHASAQALGHAASPSVVGQLAAYATALSIGHGSSLRDAVPGAVANTIPTVLFGLIVYRLIRRRLSKQGFAAQALRGNDVEHSFA